MTKVLSVLDYSGLAKLQLSELEARAKELVRFLRSAPTDTPEQEAWFSANRKQLGVLVEAIEARRMAEKRPHLDAGKAIDKTYGPAAKALKECEAVILEKLRQAAQRRLDAEREALRLAAEAAEADRPEAAIAAVASIPQKVEGDGSREGWKYEAVGFDIGAMEKSWMVPNYDKLEAECAAAKREGREPAVPGVTFEKVATIRRKS